MRFKLVIDWYDEDENICIKNSDDEEIDCIINITYPINKKFDAKEINKIIYNYLRKNLNSSSCGFIIKKLSELSPDFIIDAYLLCLITDKNRDLDLMFKNIHDYNKMGDIVYPLTLDGYYEALTDSSCKSLFLVEGNSELITIDEFKKTIDYISEVVRKIKRHNLSPLEEIIYAYVLRIEFILRKDMMRENQNHVILQKFYLEIKLCVLDLLVFLPLLLEI